MHISQKQKEGRRSTIGQKRDKFQLPSKEFGRLIFEEEQGKINAQNGNY